MDHFNFAAYCIEIPVSKRYFASKLGLRCLRNTLKRESVLKKVNLLYTGRLFQLYVGRVHLSF